MAANKKNRGGRQGRRRSSRQTSTLQQHHRQGKVFSPPLNTLGNMTHSHWLRDSFPDMIWLCTLMHQYGDDGMTLACKVLDSIKSILEQEGQLPAEVATQPASLVLTGQLTKLEQVPVDSRGKIIQRLRELDLYKRAFPWLLIRALSKYDAAPGYWLADGWRRREQIVPESAPGTFLASLIKASLHGQGAVATSAKAIVLRGYLDAGMLKFALQDFENSPFALLPRYPTNLTTDERKLVEASIRSSFLAFERKPPPDMADGEESPSLIWAKAFWRTNWELYRCELPDTAQIADKGDQADKSRDAVRQSRDAWMTELNALRDDFLDTARTTDPDLYNPDRSEVLTGITARMLRAVSIAIQYPALWTAEHGSSLVRALMEARIVLKWLLKQGDLALYARFKDYGRGRLKLLKLHLEEYRDGLDDPHQDLIEHIDYPDALVNQDIWEEFQDVSIEGNFAGIDTRRMAEEVGLLNEYRFVFAPASAAVHGEWSALDQYVLQRCGSPLHRGHRIPRDDTMLALGPELVESALGLVRQLVEDYQEAVGTLYLDQSGKRTQVAQGVIALSVPPSA